MGHHTIDGIINLDKPQGKTSFQMVALVRKLSGVRKVGHSGTLDPNATGVLPILIGKATRLASFLTNSSKTYRAEIEFGRSTTTYDSSGDVTFEGDTSLLTLKEIETSLERFRGPIQQIPPMYSAIKHQGKPLYHLARTGLEVKRQPRKVHIYRLETGEWQNPLLGLEIECSKGTYVRSLANDLGQILGCGAHLRGLVRLQAGPFHLDQSISVTELESGFQNDSWQDFVHPLDTALTNLRVITFETQEEENITHGRPATLIEERESIDGELNRAYSSNGKFLALVCYDQKTGLWHPKKVFV